MSSSDADSRSSPSKTIEPEISRVPAKRVRPMTVSERDALARARLAHDAERLAAVDRVGDAVDGLDDAVVGLEVDLEVRDFQEGHQLVPDPRIEECVDDVHDQVQEMHEEGAQAAPCPGSSPGRTLDRVEGQAADAGDVEHGLGQDRAAEQDAEVEAEDRDDRGDRGATRA